MERWVATHWVDRMRIPGRYALALWIVIRSARAAAFEPGDLELELPGVLDIDVQFGVTSTASWTALFLPDVELDLGLTNAIELDLDGGYSLGGIDGGGLLKHQELDAFWLSCKAVLLQTGNDSLGRAWILGMQLGPKLGLGLGSSGLGGEGLLLFGWVGPGVRVVLNAGAFVDPEEDDHRPAALEVGIDVVVALGQESPFAVNAELSDVGYFSDDANELAATLGVTWAVHERLDVAVLASVAYVAGAVQLGGFIGLSPKIALW